jgi:hypothetical protein
MQFTSINSMTFADVPRPQMSHANGLSNTLSQLTMAAGITLGALGCGSAMGWRSIWAGRRRGGVSLRLSAGGAGDVDGRGGHAAPAARRGG